MNAPSTKHKALHALQWVMLAKFSGQVISWLSTFLVIRLLTPDDYGLVALATVAFSLLLKVTYSGWGDGLIQAKEVGEEQVRKLLGFLVLTNGAGCFLLNLAAPWLATYFGDPRVESVSRVLSVGFLIVPWIMVPNALLSRAIRFKEKSLIGFIATLSGVATSLSLAWTGWGFWALIYAQLVHLFIQSVGLMLVCPSGWPQFNLRGIRSMLTFGGMVSLTSIIWAGYTSVDVIIGGRVLETAVIGIYSTALYLATMPMTKVMPIITEVAFPVFSELRDDAEKMRWYFRRSMRLATLITFPVFIGLAAVAPEFVPVVLGERWVDMTLPLIVLSFSIPFRVVTNLFSPVVRALGRPEVQLGNVVFTLVVLVVSFLIGVRWGAVGLAAAWLVGGTIAFVFSVVRSSGVVGFSFPVVLRDLLVPSVLSLAMYLLVRSAADLLPAEWNQIFVLLFLVLFGGVAYLALGYLFFRTSFEEVVQVWRNRKMP